jgi:hypothetical protein
MNRDAATDLPIKRDVVDASEVVYRSDIALSVIVQMCMSNIVGGINREKQPL